MTKLHIACDGAGHYIADENDCEYVTQNFITRALAKIRMYEILNDLAASKKDADIVDGYNRDDLGESPDY